MALAKSFFENKRSSDAAKVIQRHWREHRMHRMRQQQTEGYQVRMRAGAGVCPGGGMAARAGGWLVDGFTTPHTHARLPLPLLQALTNAKAMLGTLAQQHADLEQRRRANLAFSGQTLVGDNLDVLQDAVESIIAAFLLPARVSMGCGVPWAGAERGS